MDQAQYYLWLGVSQYLAGNVAAAEANLGRASTFAGRYKMHFDIGLVLYHQVRFASCRALELDAL